AGIPLAELKKIFREADLPAYQAVCVFRGIHRDGIFELEKIPEIGRKTRQFLESQPFLQPLTLLQKQESSDGTIKLSWQVASGDVIESVIIPNEEGRVTLCVSSQAGCAVGCPFCLTSYMGLKKNLTSAEIVLQYLQSRPFSPRLIKNIVFMGMGEPLHNEQEVLQACRTFIDDFGSGLGKRKVAVSTSGVASKIETFWNADICNIALSLHATTDEVRNQLVPLNKKWNLKALQETFQKLHYKNREKIMIEYVLLHEVNDTPEDAVRLLEWCQGFPSKINLIHFNSFPQAPYRASAPDRIVRFREVLLSAGLFHTFRTPRGRDVSAACGQLAY
ncbi:MAG: 23S rRNA (adenine(2503)-C(2))-methyltransferase RlmN, partial [Planctomycetota bacterium]